MRNPLGRNLRVAGVITAVTGGLIAGITPAQAGTPLNTTGIPTRYTAQNLDWHQCAADEVNLPAGAPADLVKALQCATFGAPRDWDHPGQGPDLTIAVSRLAATGTATDSVITNPGGPGEPGRWFPIALAGQTALRAHQEVIGLDVRGTGKSTTISCGDDGADLAKLDPRDRDAANLNRILDQNAAFAQACRRDNGSLLPLIDTYQTVRDIDLLRVLLGRQKVNYVGYSGGTWLGSHYAQTFPQRTGHFVLDSNTEFTASWQQSFGWQPLGVERRWREDYLPWLAKYDAKYHFGATADVAHQSYQDLRGALSRAPIDLDDGLTYGPSDLDFGVVGAMGVKATWPTFADTLVNVRTAADPAALEPAKAAARAAIKAGCRSRTTTRMPWPPRSSPPAATTPVSSEATSTACCRPTRTCAECRCPPRDTRVGPRSRGPTPRAWSALVLDEADLVAVGVEHAGHGPAVADLLGLLRQRRAGLDQRRQAGLEVVDVPVAGRAVGAAVRDQADVLAVGVVAHVVRGIGGRGHPQQRGVDGLGLLHVGHREQDRLDRRHDFLLGHIGRLPPVTAMTELGWRM